MTFLPAGESAQDRIRFCSLVNMHLRHAYPFKENEFRCSQSQFFWLVDCGTIVGTSGFTTKTPTLCEVRKTMILPEYRGRGLGYLGCLRLEGICRAAGFRKMAVTVFTTNTPMMCLRLKLGYIVEGYHPNHEAPGYDEYSLGKFIDSPVVSPTFGVLQ